MEGLFASLASLRSVVQMLDADSNGLIDRREFRSGLALLNERLPAGSRLQGDPDDLFDAIDRDRSGGITLAELAEAFRATVMQGAAP